MRTTSNKLSTPYGNLIETCFDTAKGMTCETNGVVVTPHGFVRVYSRTFYPSTTHLEFACQGRMHRRYFDRWYCQKTLVTLANRFAGEIIAEVEG